MVIPNFLIIGAQKAGTTSLVRFLGNHPDIYVPEDKEISNFYNDKQYNNKFSSYPYLKYYNSYKSQIYAGNAPVNILYFAKETAKNIYNYNPEMKIIAILRNPVDRAYSAYWYFVRCGLEKTSFENSLKREPKIIKNGSFEQRCNFTYISHGYYYNQLKYFLTFFSKKNILLISYDDLKLDPMIVYNRMMNFLGIDIEKNKKIVMKRYNSASLPKIKWLNNLINVDNPIKNYYDSLMPKSIKILFHNKIIIKLLKANSYKFIYPIMKSETRKYLSDIFFEKNESLEKIININISHWNSNKIIGD